jgi:hypothetical protein
VLGLVSGGQKANSCLVDGMYTLACMAVFDVMGCFSIQSVGHVCMAVRVFRESCLGKNARSSKRRCEHRGFYRDL